MWAIPYLSYSEKCTTDSLVVSHHVIAKLFVSLKLHLYSHFSLHTGCSDLKNIRWIDVFMYVICFSAVAPSISSCHELWKKNEIQTALFSKQSGLLRWKHASRYILKCSLLDGDKTAKSGGCSGMQINSRHAVNSIKFRNQKSAFTTETKSILNGLK